MIIILMDTCTCGDCSIRVFQFWGRSGGAHACTLPLLLLVASQRSLYKLDHHFPNCFILAVFGDNHRRWRRGGHAPHHFYGTLFARKDRDTLIEQSGSGYSNRAVTVFRFREAV